jgi:TrmH family RNA methyltransferase
MEEIIISPNNPLIKNILKFRKTAKRKKSDLIVIEGEKEIDMAIAAGFKMTDIFYCRDLLKDKADFNKFKIYKTHQVSAGVLKKITWRENPDAFLALAVPKKILLKELLLKANPLIVILDGIEKPGNLGAIMRTCDAACVDAVIVSNPQTDIYNHNVIRSSLGTVFTNRVAVSDVQEIIAWLKSYGIKIYATTPAAKNVYHECDFTRSAAIVIGTEHEGLNKEWLEAADYKIKIPMQGKIDSLNASVSAGVIIFEMIRQRANNKK